MVDKNIEKIWFKKNLRRRDYYEKSWKLRRGLKIKNCYIIVEVTLKLSNYVIIFISILVSNDLQICLLWIPQMSQFSSPLSFWWKYWNGLKNIEKSCVRKYNIFCCFYYIIIWMFFGVNMKYQILGHIEIEARKLIYL